MANRLMTLLLLVVTTQSSSAQINYFSNAVDIDGSPIKCSSRPPNIPSNIHLSKQDFENFVRTISVRNLWVAVPQRPNDVVVLVNWAKKANYTIRPLGYMHSFSPLSVTNDTDCRNTLLVDAKKNLTKMKILPNGTANYAFAAVIVQTGASLEDLTGFLESRGYGFNNYPAIGKITIGGMLAVCAHGTAVRVANRTSNLNIYGCPSNRILTIDAVVWNNELKSYTLQTFERSQYEMSALLVHLGNAFITSVTLIVDSDYLLRCVQYGIPNIELFAASSANDSRRTFGSLMAANGRVELISYPYFDNSYVRVCSEVITCPKESKFLEKPDYWTLINIKGLDQKILEDGDIKTLLVFESNYNMTKIAPLTIDVCGFSKNALLLISNITENIPRPQSFSYSVLTSRESVQIVLSQVKMNLDATLQKYAAMNIYPMNGPILTTVTELDGHTLLGDNAKYSFIAPTSPYPSYPHFDTVVWFEIVTFPNTRNSMEFIMDMESFYLTNFNGTVGFSRPEWSKAWAYTMSGAFTNASVLHIIANRYSDWDKFICAKRQLDPFNLFGNKFLDEMFKSRDNTLCSVYY